MSALLVLGVMVSSYVQPGTVERVFVFFFWKRLRVV